MFTKMLPSKLSRGERIEAFPSSAPFGRIPSRITRHDLIAPLELGCGGFP